VGRVDLESAVGKVPIAGTWRTTAPADDLWAVVADLSTWPAWWPAIQGVELLAGTAEAPEAARLTFDTPRPLPPLEVDLEVVEHVAPTRLAIRSQGGLLTGSGKLTVAPDGGGSKVDYDLRLSVRSLLLRPLELILSGATRAGGRERLHRAGDDLARLAGGEPGRHEP